MALPLSGTRVLEFAGLAPGPMVGLVLADFGADVVRVDRVGGALNADTLARGKRSVALDPKQPAGLRALRLLASRADVVIDPFRPGVLERLGLGPAAVQAGTPGDGVPPNAGVVFARLTGFQREGPYANMAGHDINYIALSGLLSMLGTRRGGAPEPPSNLLGDFAGGSFVCLLGILLALLERARSGRGQVVEADMVTGARYLATFSLLGSYLEHPQWGSIIGSGSNASRGEGALAGGAPWYGVYETQDGGWMSVGAIEAPFYKQCLEILAAATPDAPAGTTAPSPRTQNDRSTWPQLRAYFDAVFRTRTRDDWTRRFTGTDACVVPVLTRDEAARAVLPAAAAEHVEGVVVPAPAPHLSRTPAPRPAGAPGADDAEPQMLLGAGEHTLEVLRDAAWAGLSERELVRLWQSGAADGSDAPDGVDDAKL